MELKINDKVTIAELQKQFSAEFPYLKIEFFDVPHLPKQSLSKPHVYPSYRNLGVCRRIHNQGTIKIRAEDTVEKVEKAFYEQFGLSVEVFRKSGNLWIETSLSNSWTLALQNQEGQTFSEGKFKRFTNDENISD